MAKSTRKNGNHLRVIEGRQGETFGDRTIMDILSQRSKQTRDGSTLVELVEEVATVLVRNERR